MLENGHGLLNIVQVLDPQPESVDGIGAHATAASAQVVNQVRDGEELAVRDAVERGALERVDAAADWLSQLGLLDDIHNLTVLDGQDSVRPLVGVLDVSHSEFVVLPAAEVDEAGGVEGGCDIAVHQKEELVASDGVAQQRERARRPQRMLFTNVSDPDAEPAAVCAEALDQLGQISRGEHNIVKARPFQLLENQLQDRFLTDGEKRLGNRKSERPQPRSPPTHQHDCLHRRISQTRY